jgi:hypothetical protein
MGRTQLKTISLIAFIALTLIAPHTVIAEKFQKATPLNQEPISSLEKIIFNDSFEACDDWLINFLEWTCIDVDGDPTLGHSYFSWPHENEPYAFIVFNPFSTTPLMINDSESESHSGAKYIAGFNDNNLEYKNDDWLITPRLSAGSYNELSFWAKSYSDQYNLERVEVGVSTTIAKPEFMNIISSAPYITVPAEWTQYTFDISNQHGNIYVGIHMVSVDSWFLMIDDVKVTGNGTSDLIPPITSCILNGTKNGAVYSSDVQVTLTAIDNISGVNYTLYQIDNKPFSKYTVPFKVINDGEHSITYYSVDNYGNIEQKKTTTFTIQHTISLRIKGGIGIVLTIKNNGDVAADINYKIEATGLVFLKERNKTVTIEPGAEFKEKNMIFGLSMTTITATTVGSTAVAKGLVALFFFFKLE